MLIVRADVGQREDVERAISQTIGHYGTIDVLINNAGIIQVGPLDHMKLSDYDDAMKTHFWGPLFLVLAVLPHMRQSRRREDRQYLVHRRPDFRTPPGAVLGEQVRADRAQ